MISEGRRCEEVENLFAMNVEGLEEVGARARAVSSAIETSGLFIERHTSVVCPNCEQVCCINRHSYHDIIDTVCICALGEKLPTYKAKTGDTDPCQFLGEGGCTLRRSLRPHRCNWYFCTPLLEHIQSSSPRVYRGFIADLQEINKKREGLVNAFIETLKRGTRHRTSLSQLG